MSGKKRGFKGKNVVGSPSPDVFISYQWDSKSEVLKLKKELEKNKISCWMDVRQIRGGAFLNQEIAEGIKNAKVMISCLTNAYTTSKNCYREVAYADQQKKPIIPIRLEQISSSPTGISQILAPLVYINFYRSDRKFEDILRSIRAILEKCTNSVDGPTGEPTTETNMQGRENQQGKKKMSVWAAAEKGDLDGVKTAVENGADIEERGGFLEETALHYACLYGYLSITDYLIQRDAEVNSRDEDGYLPIHYACMKGHLDIVKLLLSKGSEFTSTDNYGRTPLHNASRGGHPSVAEYLIKRGAEVNCRNKYGSLPIHNACEVGHLDIVRLLINKGSDFTSTDNDGDTPLQLASMNGHAQVIYYLKQRIAKAERQRSDESTYKGDEPSTSGASVQVDQHESQRTKEQTIDNLDPLIRKRICKKLDIENEVGGDYRELAARFEMPNDDIDLISQRTNQTHKVLRWIARNPQNNIDKLKDVLFDMGRLDCVRIIEKSPK